MNIFQSILAKTPPPELLAAGFASPSELKPFIMHTISRGINCWGFPDRTLILTDGSNWDWAHEDQIYEINLTSNISIR